MTKVLITVLVVFVSLVAICWACGEIIRRTDGDDHRNDSLDVDYDDWGPWW